MFTPRLIRLPTAMPVFHRPARGAEDRAAFLVDVIHKVRSQHHGLQSAFGIKPAITVAESQHFLDIVDVVQFQKGGADDRVNPGQMPPQVTMPARTFRGSKKSLSLGPRHFKEGFFRRRNGRRPDYLQRYAQGIIDGATNRRF